MISSLGCSDEQDFDQIDDLDVISNVASSIFYLESDEQFINSATTIQSFYSQTFSFDAFNEEFVAERLLEGVIIYEIENTTSKRIRVTVEFLDEAGNVIDLELFEIEPTPAQMQRIEVPYGPNGKDLGILTTTSNLRVTGNNLSDTSSTSSISEPKIIFRSAADFIFGIE